MADDQQYGENFADDQQYGEYNDQSYTEAMDQSGDGAKTEVNGTNGSTKPASDDDRKLFVGGISWDTDSATVKEYFTKFGEVQDVTLKTDPATGKSRGFGFVTFAAEESVDNVLKNMPHSIKGKQVDPKRAKARPGIKKIFVGGLDTDYPEADIRSYFEKYGKVEQVELPFDKVKNQRRQFCFVTFETEDACEQSCKQSKQKIGNKECDVKKATNKPGPQAAGRGGFGGFGGRGRGRGAARGRGGPGFAPPQGWGAAPGYGAGYGGQYGYQQGGYGAGGYGAYGDYSGYGAGGYGAGGGYGGYDYSGWNYGQGSGGYGGAAGYGQQPSTYGKAPRRGAAAGGAGAGGAAAGYHPYSR